MSVQICYNGSGRGGAVTTVYATNITLGIEVENGTVNAPPFQGSGNSYQLYMYDINGTLLATFNDWPTYGAHNASAANPQTVRSGDGNEYTANWTNTGFNGSGFWGFNIDVSGLQFATGYQFSIGCYGEGWAPTSPTTTIWTAPIWITDAYTIVDGSGQLWLNAKFYLAEYVWGIANDVDGAHTGNSYTMSLVDTTTANTLWSYYGGYVGSDVSVLANVFNLEGAGGTAFPSINIDGYADSMDSLVMYIQWYGVAAGYDTAAALQTYSLSACLGAGTQITLADGSSTKAIEDVQNKDVLASHGGDTVTVLSKLSCAIKHADMYVIPKGTYGATADIVLSRLHGFWASADEYRSKVSPRLPYRDPGCIAYTPPTDAATPASAGAGTATDVPAPPKKMHDAAIMYNLRINGGVMFANGVYVVGM